MLFSFSSSREREIESFNPWKRPLLRLGDLAALPFSRLGAIVSGVRLRVVTEDERSRATRCVTCFRLCEQRGRTSS